ncbi:MAG: hypothetical protein LBH73_08105 [Spirochaetaceae bacterium]|jgi:hypothetical protein|nr:hypothetical protein [Spirochaetaceae bacterium]
MTKREILVIYGKDIAGMAYELASQASLAGLIGDRKKKIGLKPNLVNASHPREGATTHPEILAGLVDAWSAVQLGYLPLDIPYIGLAEKLGVGSADTGTAQVREINAPEKRAPSLKSRGRAREFAPLIDARSACSSCYASLILALSLLDKAALKKIDRPLAIGQGFTGKKGRTGIGRCTALFEQNLPGCPPSHQAMLEFLEKTLG